MMCRLRRCVAGRASIRLAFAGLRRSLVMSFLGAAKSMRRSSVAKCAAGILLLFATSVAASAHPHVWVAVKSEVLFGGDGKISGIRHAWTFDEMYSAFATQGFGKDGKAPTSEELQPLAKVNVESLAEF